MTFNEQREVFYHLIGFILFSSIVLTGYGVMLTGSSPLAPHVLWKLGNLRARGAQSRCGGPGTAMSARIRQRGGSTSVQT
jgi:hypothetical protein